MASTSSSPNAPALLPTHVTSTVKLLVCGHYGAGKTTLVSRVSEIAPLHTEEPITAASIGVDDLAGLPHKHSTTVALDFGRRTFGSTALYLFGTPGQKRFAAMWDDLAQGAKGALVLVDTRRLDAADEILATVEERQLPFAVAVNRFDGAPDHPAEEIREALDLAPPTPLTFCDARDFRSSVHALITLMTHLTARGDRS
ncbi:ATP/GTP-binding protein (plasmid) [Streptomyces viridifaciens]|nr:ATP/GTP-binding protein [Streptomyces viridifaciens]